MISVNIKKFLDELTIGELLIFIVLIGLEEINPHEIRSLTRS